MPTRPKPEGESKYDHSDHSTEHTQSGDLTNPGSGAGSDAPVAPENLHFAREAPFADKPAAKDIPKQSKSS